MKVVHIYANSVAKRWTHNLGLTHNFFASVLWNESVMLKVVEVMMVSLRNRTVERRGRQNAWARQTWWGYYLRVLSGIHLTLMFLALLQKDWFKGMWSLAEAKQNYCHACHTRFAVVFLLPSFCVSSLIMELTQKHFWAMHVNQKWTFCILLQWPCPNFRANRLRKSKDTKGCAFCSVRA